MTSCKQSVNQAEKIGFISCRAFQKDENGDLLHFRDQMQMLSEKLLLGKVIALHMSGINARNRDEFLKFCGEKGYTIFDVWGYVPGNRPSGVKWYLQGFGEFSLSQEERDETCRLLDGRFLGYDIGEQDSRYLMIFAPQDPVASLDRTEQYRRQYDFFARMRRDLCQDFSVLAGSTAIHYPSRERGCRMIGGETLQIHPNINVWQAFIRGASRQYDVPWFGTVSVFNAFGYRTSGADRTDEFGMEAGRNRGPSDSLLRRVFHYLYESGAALMGFEHFIEENGELTTVGKIQREVMELAKSRRRIIAPVAILLDFFQGWQPPRNAVNRETHRLWGELPYAEEDFRVDALFEFLYPGYSDGPVFRDEHGFLVNTPYGDTVEVLLSDVRPEILDEYKLVIIPGIEHPDAEVQAKLLGFMNHGGRVVCTGENPLNHPNLAHIDSFIEATGHRDFINAYEKSLPPPFRLTAEAREVLDRELRRAIPFTIQGSALAVANEELLLVMNNAAAPQEVSIPEAGFRQTLGPGEMVRVPFVSPATPAAPPKPRKRCLAALRSGNWREQLMRIPAFGNYFSGIVISAAELLRLTDDELAVQREFFDSHGLEIAACDMSNCFSHYPGLSMLGTGIASTAEALDTVRETIRKMTLLNCRNLILPTQKNSELATTEAIALERIGDFLRRCAELDVVLHIAVLPHRFGDGATAMRERLAEWGLTEKVKLYCDTGSLLTCREYSGSIKHGYPKQDGEPRNCFPKDYALLDEPRDTGCLADILRPLAPEIHFLGISAPLRDFAGRLINAHLPPRDTEFRQEIIDAVSSLPQAVPVIDLDRFDWDPLFTTYQLLEALTK